MKRTRRHWLILAATAGGVGIGVALGQAAITQEISEIVGGAAAV